MLYTCVIDADQQTVSLLSNGHGIPTKYEQINKTALTDQTNDLRIKKKKKIFFDSNGSRTLHHMGDDDVMMMPF